MDIQIPDRIFTQIMTCLGYPYVKEEELELNFLQIKEDLIAQALQEYYRWFPIETYQSVDISGPFEIPFPRDTVFSAKDIRSNASRMSYGPYGNALVDERFVQSTSGPYGSRAMYGTKNDYGFTTALASRRFEARSQLDMNKSFKVRILENQRKVVGFTNAMSTLEITWAEWSTDFSYVSFTRERDFIKLSQAFILDFFGNLRTQEKIADAPIELNGEAFVEKSKTLFEEVYGKWRTFTTPIIMRG